MSVIAAQEGLRVAVLLPSYNDARSIGLVVRGFSEALPGAEIFVFDNNSTDDTARAAALAGARIFREVRQGKSNVVRRMFADIDADIYVMATGDGGSDPADAPSLINALITEHVDVAIGRRAGAPTFDGRLERWLFRGSSSDFLSGYRAFTRRFVKSFPAIPTGLAIEAELSVHASQLMVPVAEIDLTYGAGLPRELNRSLIDRFRNLRNLATLTREMRPFAFLAAFAMLFWAVGLTLAAPAFAGWVGGGGETPVFAIIAGSGMFVVGFVLAGTGLILEEMKRARIEQKRILFLAAPALGVQ